MCFGPAVNQSKSSPINSISIESLSDTSINYTPDVELTAKIQKLTRKLFKAQNRILDSRKLRSCDKMDALHVKMLDIYKEWMACRQMRGPLPEHDRGEYIEGKEYVVSGYSAGLAQKYYNTFCLHANMQKRLSKAPYIIDTTHHMPTLEILVDNQPMLFAIKFKDPKDKENVQKLEILLKCPLDPVTLDSLTQQLKINKNELNIKLDLEWLWSPDQMSLVRIYTPDEIVTFIKSNQLEHVENYLNNDDDDLPWRNNLFYSKIIFKKLAYTQSQLKQLFLKCKNLANLGNQVLLNSELTLEPQDAEHIFAFAFQHQDSRALHVAQRTLPSFKLENKTIDDLLWLIERGFYSFAKQLIQNGLSANASISKFDFSTLYSTKTTLGNFLNSHPEYHHCENVTPLDFLRFLLANGANPNQCISANYKSDHSCSVLEACYHKRIGVLETKGIYADIFLILLEHGAIISPRLAKAMILDIKASGKGINAEYVKYLIQQDYLPKDNLEQFLDTKHPVSYSTYSHKMLENEALSFCDNVVSVSSLQEHRLDLNLVSKARLLKKEMKKRIHAEPKINLLFKSCYKQLCLTYDEVVANHLLLNELSIISHDIRRLTSQPKINRRPDTRLTRFYGLFEPGSSFIREDAIEKIKNLTIENRASYWEAMRSKVIDIAIKVNADKYLSRHFITWVHGTQSKSLPVILKVGALKPLGKLLKDNVVTFSGECCGADSSLNKDKISGERLTTSWNDGEWFYHDNLSRLHTSIQYATSTRGHRPNERVFKPNLAWERVSIPHVEELLRATYPEKVSDHRFWSTIRLDILRLRSTDSEADKKMSEFKKHIVDKLKGPLKENHQQELKDLLQSLTSSLPYTFSKDDIEIINDPQPYPVIFASTTTYSTPHFDKKKTNILEYMVEDSIDLGSEIQVAFTIPERIDALKKLLKPYNIRVYDIETAFYLELMHMARGFNNPTDELIKAKPFNPSIIASSLQQDILPRYASPFPPNPSYRDEKLGKRVKLANPWYGPEITSYDDYLKKVELGEILARTIHGPIHAVRVAIWSLLLLKLYSLRNDKLDIDRYWLALSAAAHDIARQDESIDRWDKSSAKWLKGYMLSRGKEKKEIEPYVFALEHKDPIDGTFTTTIQKIIHDADCLEILRCLKDPKKDFRKNELCFYREFKNDTRSLNLDALIVEIQQFIYCTELPEIKKDFEKSPANCFNVAMRMLASKGYPNIEILFKKELDFYRT